jgi:carboxymethylenebutenolidase
VSDLGAVLDEHLRCEFVTGDAAATMATMVAEPYLHHVPMMTGGVGRDEVFRFYRDVFIPSWPDDTETESISRTVGADHVVDEVIVRFTHDREMPFMLPGVPPTGRHVALSHAVVVGFEDGLIHHEHIYWDQASLLIQVGLLDPDEMPAIGAEQASRVVKLARGAYT